VAVIDDDEAVLDSLRMMLTRDGFEVRTFKSAEDYLAAKDAEQAGCVVCDVRLPHMSGLDLQAELQKRRSSVPLILITGHGNISMAVSAVKAGAHGSGRQGPVKQRNCASPTDQSTDRRNLPRLGNGEDGRQECG